MAHDEDDEGPMPLRGDPGRSETRWDPQAGGPPRRPGGPSWVGWLIAAVVVVTVLLILRAILGN